VYAPGGKPCAGMKGTDDGGAITVVNREGQAQGGLMRHGDATEVFVTDGQGNIAARILGNERGGLIATQKNGRPAVSMMTAKEGGMIILQNEDGEPALNLSNLGGSGQISLYDENGKQRINLMTVQGTSWVCVSNQQGKEVCTLSSVNDAGFIEASAQDGSHRVTLDGDGPGRLVIREGDASPAVLITRGETGGSLSIHDNAGQLAALLDVEGNLDRPAGRIGVGARGAKSLRAMLSVDAAGQGLLTVLNGEGENRAILSGQQNGGVLHCFGSEGADVAVFGGTPNGGALTLSNDLGITRAAMCVHKDGGQLQLYWAGSPVATLSAQETCGMMYLFDSEGEMKLRLPEDAPPEEM
jgi:hypothetical protein